MLRAVRRAVGVLAMVVRDARGVRMNGAIGGIRTLECEPGHRDRLDRQPQRDGKQHESGEGVLHDRRTGRSTGKFNPLRRRMANSVALLATNGSGMGISPLCHAFRPRPRGAAGPQRIVGAFAPRQVQLRGGTRPMRTANPSRYPHYRNVTPASAVRRHLADSVQQIGPARTAERRRTRSSLTRRRARAAHLVEERTWRASWWWIRTRARGSLFARSFRTTVT